MVQHRLPRLLRLRAPALPQPRLPVQRGMHDGHHERVHDLHRVREAICPEFLQPPRVAEQRTVRDRLLALRERLDEGRAPLGGPLRRGRVRERGTERAHVDAQDEVDGGVESEPGDEFLVIAAVILVSGTGGRMSTNLEVEGVPFGQSGLGDLRRAVDVAM